MCREGEKAASQIIAFVEKGIIATNGGGNYTKKGAVKISSVCVFPFKPGVPRSVSHLIITYYAQTVLVLRNDPKHAPAPGIQCEHDRNGQQSQAC